MQSVGDFVRQALVKFPPSLVAPVPAKGGKASLDVVPKGGGIAAFFAPAKGEAGRVKPIP